MFDITVAGNMIVDLIKEVEFYPERLALAPIHKLSRAPGGAVNNVIVDLARLDGNLKLAAAGCVGQDELGDFMLEKLAEYPSIDLGGVRREGDTSFTDVMSEPGGERTFFTYKGADNKLGYADFDFEAHKTRLLHFGYILLVEGMDAPDAEYGTVLARTLHAAQQAGVATSVDVVSESSDRFARIVPPSLRYADYCTVNEFEAERITGVPLRDTAGKLLAGNMPEACEAMKEMGVRRWVTIHTPEAAFGIDEKGIFAEAKSLRLPKGYIRGSVGAGDAFVAGLLYEIHRGASQVKAMDVANAVAASSLAAPDASSGVKPYAQVLELAQELRG